jgi:hypothetical protein
MLGRQPEWGNDSQPHATPRPPSGAAGSVPAAGPPTDEPAVERYRYLLRTAPPEAIEEAHAEAFARLTPEQRRLVLEDLRGELPPQERADRDDPQSLARMATRAELRRPGTLERAFGGFPGGLGGFVAADFLSTVAGFVVGSAIAAAFFGGGAGQWSADGAEAADGGQGTDAADAGYAGGDAAGGGFGGDFGGGEF